MKPYPLRIVWSWRRRQRGDIVRRNGDFLRIVAPMGRWRYLARPYNPARPEGRWA